VITALIVSYGFALTQVQDSLSARETEQQRDCPAERNGTQEEPFCNRDSHDSHDNEPNRYQNSGELGIHTHNSEWAGVRFCVMVLHLIAPTSIMLLLNE
jgi:hypothetical protein